MRLRRRQRGVAVLTVLLVVAIGSVLVYALASQQAMVMAQSRQVLVGDSLRDMLLGGEVLARQMLYADWEDDNANPPATDHGNEPWAQEVPPFEVPGGFIEIQARDLHGCLNINAIPTAGGGGQQTAQGNVVQVDQRGLLRRALEDTGLAADFLDKWSDWIDPDDQVGGFGAEDNDYTGLDLPFRAANQPAGHLSEFRLLEAMEPEQWQALQQVFCVAPAETQMNVNSFSPQMIAFLTGNDWVELEQEDGEPNKAGATLPEHEKPDDFISAHTFTGNPVPVTLLSVTSDYFEISIRAELDGQQAEMVSTLYRDPANGTITVLGRDYSRRFVSRFEVEET